MLFSYIGPLKPFDQAAILFVAQAAMTRQVALEEVMDRTRVYRNHIDAEINSRKQKFRTSEDPRLSEEESKR